MERFIVYEVPSIKVEHENWKKGIDISLVELARELWWNGVQLASSTQEGTRKKEYLLIRAQLMSDRHPEYISKTTTKVHSKQPRVHKRPRHHESEAFCFK